MKYFSFSFKQLRILETIKNEVNLRIAGETLYLSQPALSSQIRQLESNLYSKILIRQKNKVSFTTDGELVLDYANKILKLCQEADDAILYLKKLKKFSLKIGSNILIGEKISLKLINLFCKRYSYAHVQLQIGCTESIAWNIINGRIDIGVVEDEEVLKNLSHSLYTIPYFQEEMLLVLPKQDKQKYIKPITKKDLYKLNFISIKLDSEERKFLDNNLKNFNINFKQLKIILELNSISAVKNAVQAGIGVSFLPTMLVKEEIYLKRLHPVLLDGIQTKRKFLLIANLRNTESYLCEQFYNYCFTILKPKLYTKFLNLS